MKLNINNKDYELEYTFEAVASEECVKKTLDMMQNLEREDNELSEKISVIPNTVISLFYAGLLENHSEEIKNENDARTLLKAYFKENKDNEDVENASFYGMMLAIINQMDKDGFFAQIGLVEKKKTKVPQDHKKATKKA